MSESQDQKKKDKHGINNVDDVQDVRKDKLINLEKEIHNLKNENKDSSINQLREMRKKLDEIHLDKLRISENMSQSMSCIPETSTL